MCRYRDLGRAIAGKWCAYTIVACQQIASLGKNNIGYSLVRGGLSRVSQISNSAFLSTHKASQCGALVSHDSGVEGQCGYHRTSANAMHPANMALAKV